MSVLDNVPAPKKDYNFLTGDISFIDEMDQEKQPMEIDERPEFVGDAPEIPEVPIESEENPDELNAAPGETAEVRRMSLCLFLKVMRSSIWLRRIRKDVFRRLFASIVTG